MKTPLLVSPETAQAMGYATFNSAPHLCVDFPALEVENLTVSVKLPHRNEHVTFCLMSSADRELECVDLLFHHQLGNYQRLNPANVYAFNENRPVQKAIMFSPGEADNQIRDQRIFGTLLTLLTNPKHYQQ